MDTNMTFRMDSDIKARMAEICSEIGMSQSTAFNIFAKAFVRAKGMPFPVTAEAPHEKPYETVSRAKMLADTNSILNEFADDYKRMAE